MCPGDGVAREGWFFKGLLMAYFSMSSLVMFNTLVAMMNNTVNRIQEESKVHPPLSGPGISALVSCAELSEG
jgi:hypothetical protein